jgi:hypothetical protein
VFEEKYSQESADAFEKSLRLHIACVQEAGRHPLLDLPEQLLAMHDESKWSHQEYAAYARWFFGDKQNADEFAFAWLHHIHNNPHHWQYWIFSDGWQLKGSKIVNGCMPMDSMYAREMIADWMGASKAYTGSFDMTDWLSKNVSRIRLHPETADYVREILDHMGYADVVNVASFGQ